MSAGGPPIRGVAGEAVDRGGVEHRGVDQPGVASRHPARLAGAGGARRLGRRVVVAAVVALVALLAVLLGGAMRGDPSRIRSPLIDRPAPAFDLPRLDGPGRVSLASLRGHVVVVNFWASWCVPCRAEHGALAAAWERYRDHGVVVLGVSYQDRREDALAFRRELGGDWPLVSDPGSRTALAFGVTGVPETFFVDPRGLVAHKTYGAVTYDVLVEQIERLSGRRGPR